ncbi:MULTISPECIES: DUF6471 domain-containing protein [Marinicauda]|uniref:DUF6471 domain-containing protein n=1 Tax=Marinicauda TaxID=1649466 RepID=UPI003530703B
MSSPPSAWTRPWTRGSRTWGGLSETEPNIRNRLSCGKFTAALVLACLEAIGSQELRL